MKQKLFTLGLIIWLFSGMTLSAQGLYSEDDLLAPTGELENSYDAPLRGGDGTELPPDPPGSPLGEGIFILSALAGGYALIKKRSSKKENNL
jgi:hypothetical protein